MTPRPYQTRVYDRRQITAAIEAPGGRAYQMLISYPPAKFVEIPTFGNRRGFGSIRLRRQRNTGDGLAHYK